MLQEYVNGQLKNKYGDVFIRGNNGKHLAAVNLLLQPWAVCFLGSCSVSIKVCGALHVPSTQPFALAVNCSLIVLRHNLLASVVFTRVTSYASIVCLCCAVQYYTSAPYGSNNPRQLAGLMFSRRTPQLVRN